MWIHRHVCRKCRPANNDQARSWSAPYAVAKEGACRRFKGGHPSNYACLGDNATEFPGDDFVADRAVAELHALVAAGTTAAHGKPFFLAAGMHKPHLPYYFPPRFAALYPPEATIPIPPPEALRVRGTDVPAPRVLTVR